MFLNSLLPLPCSIAVDSGDSYLAAVTADAGEAATSAVRIYDIGRHPVQVRLRC